MKKRLLYVMSAVAFVAVLGINISGAVKSNNQGTTLETLNITAIANAEDTVHDHGPKHNPLFGKNWCECTLQIDCVED
jgi:hypothetical protein